MGEANFQIVIDGEKVFDRTFQRFDLVLDDLTPIWREVVKEFYLIEKEQFKTEGAAGKGGKWKPLTKKYAEIKKKKYGNKTILRRTDDLYKSLTSKSQNSIIDIGKTELTLGSSLVQFKHSQRKGKNQRKPIDMSEIQLRRIQKTIQRQLIVEMKKQGINFR